nr:hypothetical protein [Bacteroidia bacterium]
MLHNFTTKVNAQFKNQLNTNLATLRFSNLLPLKVVFLLVFIILAFNSNAQLSGIKTVGTGKNYSNIAAAIADLNASGVGSGGVTFNVDAGHTETFASSSVGLITATGTLTNPIIFQKIGTGANPLITAATGVSNNDGIVTIAGGDFITFDGIDVQENASNIYSTTQMEWAYAILKSSATDGAKSTTIKNCNITLKSGSGIYIANHLATSNSGLTITDTAGRHTNIVILNNTIKNVTDGIRANSSTSGIFDTWLQLIGNHIQVFTNYGIHQNYQTFSAIKGNRLENATAYAGMRIWQCNNSTITENVIYKLTGNAINYGAITTFYTTNLVLANNIIDSIVYTASLYHGNGMLINYGSDSIYNNKISRIYAPNGVTNLAVCGIQTNSNSKIFNNTIFLDCSSGGNGFGSNAIVSGSSLDLRNNILYNTSTHGITAAIRLTVAIANYNSNSNNNLFYAGTPSATNLLFTAGTNNLETIDALKSFLTTRDQKSVSDLVNFISTTSSDNDYLKIDTSIPTVVESRGQKIIGIDDDFNTVGIRKTYPKAGQLNGGGTLPDIGAVEFDGTPFTEFTVGVGKDYSTLAAAIAYLNTNALAGKYVTFNVSANHTETFATATAGLI